MEWISIDTRLPPQDIYVLVAWWDDRERVQMYSVRIAKRIGNEWFDDRNEEKIAPKWGYCRYWMVLPDEPK